MNGAPAGPSLAALGCTNTTTTNNEPTQMTPVCDVDVRRRTIDAWVANMASPPQTPRVFPAWNLGATLP